RSRIPIPDQQSRSRIGIADEGSGLTISDQGSWIRDEGSASRVAASQSSYRTLSVWTLSSASAYHLRQASRISGVAPCVCSSAIRAAAAPFSSAAVCRASAAVADARNHALVATETPTFTISDGLVLSGRSRLVW